MASPRPPAKFRDHHARPWTRKARYSPGFRRWLARHRLLTPNFSIADTAVGRDGTPVPRWMRAAARNHAFDLERFRHEIGDRPIVPISWYRTRAYNAEIGGARFSQHLTGRATDYDRATVERVGRARWFRAAEKVFAKGGVGDYPAGSAHLDSRGFRARWRSY